VPAVATCNLSHGISACGLSAAIRDLSDISIPSPLMIAYAVVYLFVALCAAIFHFHQRDL
jgi:hypothetical protein